MFPGDYLPTVYCDDRVAADEANRLARLQQEHVLKQAQKVASAQAQNQKLNQPVPVSASSGLLGTFVQGFMPGFGTRSATASPCNSQAPTPVPTPRQEKTAASLSEEMEKLVAERKRDADIVSLAALSHCHHEFFTDILPVRYASVVDSDTHFHRHWPSYHYDATGQRCRP